MKDKKDLLKEVLKKIEEYNNKLSFEELQEEYEGYFDRISDKTTHKEFKEMCLNEEYNYKREYSFEELKEVLENLNNTHPILKQCMKGGLKA